MNLNFKKDTVSIEDLTFRQLALIELVLREASQQGGYQIDIDDYQIIMEGFNEIDIKDVYDLQQEKQTIENNVRRIMKEYDTQENKRC